jgi:hypothetical protein
MYHVSVIYKRFPTENNAVAKRVACFVFVFIFVYFYFYFYFFWQFYNSDDYFPNLLAAKISISSYD